jgi:hypothetical protein
MPIRSRFLIRYAALLALALSAGAVTAAAPGPSDIQPLSPAMRAAMTGTAWKPGCPVPAGRSDRGRPASLSRPAAFNSSNSRR